MELATGAMGSLLPKLVKLLKDEYKLQKGVKQDIKFLCEELQTIDAALRKVAAVPRDQLDELVRIWTDDVRELSYNMEDVVDSYLVGVEESKPAADMHKFKRLMEKMNNLLTKGKSRHQIADKIKDIKAQVKEVADRRERYKFNDVVVKPADSTTIDPRLQAMYTDLKELVGIHGKRDKELLHLLYEGDIDKSKKKPKIVSVVGFAGLGKTTLVRAVYDKIKGDFNCKAFVPVGRSVDAKKVLLDILIDLGKVHESFPLMDARQLIDKLRGFLQNERYLIVIDDIWDENLWKVIKLAFSNGTNLGSRVITTTRVFRVAEACCLSSDDSLYQMEPLSDGDSKELFYKRIFPCGCPSDFEKVSKDILKKCGGVPLAIITISSLLASDKQVKPKHEWHVLLKYIGRGLTEGASMEEMQKILLFSYYDLPSHLKACLLYLSIFPEDYKIERDRLIYRWIAEGLAQCGKQESGQFGIGVTYFNELIDRSLIQPVYNVYGGVEACRVHDMVLDLIISLSREENFVSILDGIGQCTSQSKRSIRRLSLQDGKLDQTASFDSMGTSKVRSFTIFEPAHHLMPQLSIFSVLRVLDLNGFRNWKGCHCKIKDVGDLPHLRYLGLANTSLREVPAEIGKLQFLEVLDITGTYIQELPLAVSKLRSLMCISGLFLRIPDGSWSLTSLEVLKNITCSTNVVKQMRNMARLRELVISSVQNSSEWDEAFVESLSSMENIQNLNIDGHFYSLDILGERWVPPPHLHKFDSFGAAGIFSLPPMWIKRDPSLLSNLSVLKFRVSELHQEDLLILGRLPALRHLNVSCFSDSQSGLLIIGANGLYSKLRYFRVVHFSSVLTMFEEGALPEAEHVEFTFGVRVAKDGGKGDFDCGLGNLRSLKEARVLLYEPGATYVEKADARAALWGAVEIHPNHPSIIFEYAVPGYIRR